MPVAISEIHSISAWAPLTPFLGRKELPKKRQESANKIPEKWRIPVQVLGQFKAPLSENKTDLIRAEAIRKSGILTERELKITEDYTVADLLSALADGSLTAVEVTLAYSKRAALAQQLVRISVDSHWFLFQRAWSSLTEYN